MSSRAEMVNVLRGLGVDIPADTKMSETRLSEKLDKALDCTQLASQRLPSLSLSPQSLPSWDGKNVGEDFTPDNATENNVIMGLLQSPEEMEPVGNDDFMDLRVVLLSLSYQYDTGRIATVIQNKQGTSAMCIKIVKVLKLNDKTPVIVILYDHALSNNRKPDNLEFCERELSFLLQPFVAGSIGAQQLLLRLLRLNAPRLPESYKPFRQPYERDFHLSFLMPTGPLTLADIGSLNKDKGCDVCGEKAFKNCASCGIALYCGKPCQEQAWPSHKRQCKALSSGVWTTVKFQPLLDAMPFMAGMHSVNLNRYTRTDEVKSGSGGRTKETRNPPPNDHGTKPFIIKIQTTQASIRVYDRRRTLDLYLMSKNDPVNFRRLHEAAGTGFKGMKCYRWAKRVSDWELSICLDIKLPEDPKW